MWMHSSHIKIGMASQKDRAAALMDTTTYKSQVGTHFVAKS
jgi:hypothetical protein